MQSNLQLIWTNWEDNFLSHQYRIYKNILSNSIPDRDGPFLISGDLNFFVLEFRVHLIEELKNGSL